ncbi:unnamed protein product [Ectocarpus sp. 12 AP-2014]
MHTCARPSRTDVTDWCVDLLVRKLEQGKQKVVETGAVVRPPKLHTRRLGRSGSSLRIPWDYPTGLPLLRKRERVGLVLTQQGLHHIGPVCVGCCSPACSPRYLLQLYHSQANKAQELDGCVFSWVLPLFTTLLPASAYPTYLPAWCSLSSTRCNEVRCQQIET